MDLSFLEANIHKLPVRDREFASDLCRKNKKYGLSEKQAYWAEVLTERAAGVTVEQPEQVVEQVGDFHKVIELFVRAKKFLKFPKIVLQDDHRPIALSLAGAASKNAGSVNVTDGRPFGQNIWYGAVAPDGNWKKNSKVDAEEAEAVSKFLKRFGQDPAKVAKESALLTGRCCFCNSALTDERSTAAGFGPTCAKNYGLEAEWKAGTTLFDKLAETAQEKTYKAVAGAMAFDQHPNPKKEQNAYYRASMGT